MRRFSALSAGLPGAVIAWRAIAFPIAEAHCSDSAGL